MINLLWDIVLIPLILALGSFVIALLKTKITEIKEKTDNEFIKYYLDQLQSLVEKAVTATNQTYVDTLKQQGKFDKEAQVIAFNKTKEAVMEILDSESKVYLVAVLGDLDKYIDVLIENAVNQIKQ